MAGSTKGDRVSFFPWTYLLIYRDDVLSSSIEDEHHQHRSKRSQLYPYHTASTIPTQEEFVRSCSASHLAQSLRLHNGIFEEFISGAHINQNVYTYEAVTSRASARAATSK
jgi:hypothetical protein